MKKYFILAAFFIIALSLPVMADPSAEALSSAASNAKAAQELVHQAENVLAGKPDRTRMELALNLYVKAGQMFERSYKIYSTLGPTYASPQDIEGSRNAMQNCINNINELRKRL